jgi:cytochrome c oxidase cbb3-type subunit IV
MTYELVQSISAMAGLFIFVALFIVVLVFVFWPGNQEGFKEAARLPLEPDEVQVSKGGRK